MTVTGRNAHAAGGVCAVISTTRLIVGDARMWGRCAVAMASVSRSGRRGAGDGRGQGPAGPGLDIRAHRQVDELGVCQAGFAGGSFPVSLDGGLAAGGTSFEVRLLGPVQAVRAGREVALGGPAAAGGAGDAGAGGGPGGSGRAAGGGAVAGQPAAGGGRRRCGRMCRGCARCWRRMPRWSRGAAAMCLSVDPGRWTRPV